MVLSLFYEDVVTWLDLHEIRYTPKVKFTGKSGFDHLFDFVIPKSRSSPERHCPHDQSSKPGYCGIVGFFMV